MAQLLKLHLSNAGYVVTIANDAIAAGYRLFKFAPDLIILDVNLPYINGLEFAATLQADTKIPHIPIVFITSDENFAPEAERLGADFILKPFPKARLLESVARTIAAYPMGTPKPLRKARPGEQRTGSHQNAA